MGCPFWTCHDLIYSGQYGFGHFRATNEEKTPKPGLFTTYIAFSGEPSGLWPFNF